ncbi:MAG TPA: DUF3024 domain-containing protein [Candidatus Saccharimonadales bacterium]|nr:DUF3024 domain-containing protein [Candidatus Saccharimonadales bacterium]
MTPDDNHDESHAEGTLPEDLKRKVTVEMDRFCDTSRPASLRSRTRLSFRFDGDAIVLYEARREVDGHQGWKTHSVARFRYVASSGRWHLDNPDGNGSWRASGRVPPASRLPALLKAYTRTSTDVFWG